MNWLGRWASKILAKQVGTDPGTLVSMVSAGNRYSSRKANTRMMLIAWETSPWFRAVVERVAWAAAIVPWRMYAVKPDRSAKAVGDWCMMNPGKNFPTFIKHRGIQWGESQDVRQKIAQQLHANDRLTEITDHLFFDLVTMPNPVITGVDMRLITFATLIVIGEMGWATQLGNAGQPIALWPIPPHWITGLPGENSGCYIVTVNGNSLKFPAEQFIHFRNPTLENPYYRGSGLGVSLADELETDEYISKFQNTWFTNRGQPDLVISVKPNDSGQGPDTDELKRAKDKFENEYRDFRKGGRSFWMRGDVDIQKLDQKLVDLDLTEQRTWIKDLVRQVIGAPPEAVGDLTNSNRATVTEAVAILAMLTTVPQLERMRAQLQMQLIPLMDDRLVLDYWSPVPEDREFKLKAIQAAPHTVEVGEMRRLQGLDERGEADRMHWVPLNFLAVPAPQENDKRPEKPKDDDDDKGEKQVKTLPATKATPADVETWLLALQPETLTKEVRGLWSDEFKKWGETTTAELGIDPTAFSMVNPFVRRHLLDFNTNRIKGINGTTLKQMRETLLEGVRAGEGIDDLAKRVNEVFDAADKQRSTVIARTEVVRSSNASTYSAYSQSGIVKGKQWVAAFIDTRDTHKELNGDIVGLDELFKTENGSTLFPGSFDVAEEDINCMCTIVAVLETEDEGKSLEQLEAIGKVFVSRETPWEKKAKRAFRRGFSNQEQDMLEAMGVAS